MRCPGGSLFRTGQPAGPVGLPRLARPGEPCRAESTVGTARAGARVFRPRGRAGRGPRMVWPRPPRSAACMADTSVWPCWSVQWGPPRRSRARRRHGGTCPCPSPSPTAGIWCGRRANPAVAGAAALQLGSSSVCTTERESERRTGTRFEPSMRGILEGFDAAESRACFWNEPRSTLVNVRH